MTEGTGEADRSATLHSRLEDATDDVPNAAPPCATIADPVALLRHLEASGHFHRDSRVGRMYHAEMVSLREDVPGVPMTRLPPLQACLARHPAGDVLMLTSTTRRATGLGRGAASPRAGSASGPRRAGAPP